MKTIKINFNNLHNYNLKEFPDAKYHYELGYAIYYAYGIHTYLYPDLLDIARKEFESVIEIEPIEQAAEILSNIYIYQLPFPNYRSAFRLANKIEDRLPILAENIRNKANGHKNQRDSKH